MNRTEPKARTNARTPKKGAARDRALALLLEGRTVPDVATELGCGRVTVWAWTKDPDFAAELAERRAAARDLAELHLADAAVDAIKTLREVMAKEYAPPASRWRIAAAEAVLRFAYPRPGPVAVAVAPGHPREPDPEREVIAARILAELAAVRPRTLEADPCQ